MHHILLHFTASHWLACIAWHSVPQNDMTWNDMTLDIKSPGGIMLHGIELHSLEPMKNHGIVVLFIILPRISYHFIPCYKLHIKWIHSLATWHAFDIAYCMLHITSYTVPQTYYVTVHFHPFSISSRYCMTLIMTLIMTLPHFIPLYKIKSPDHAGAASGWWKLTMHKSIHNLTAEHRLSM